MELPKVFLLFRHELYGLLCMYSLNNPFLQHTMNTDRILLLDKKKNRGLIEIPNVSKLNQ